VLHHFSSIKSLTPCYPAPDGDDRSGSAGKKLLIISIEQDVRLPLFTLVIPRRLGSDLPTAAFEAVRLQRQVFFSWRLETEFFWVTTSYAP